MPSCTCATRYKEMRGGLNHERGCPRRTACGKTCYTYYSAYERQAYGLGFSQWQSCLRPMGHEGECSDYAK